MREDERKSLGDEPSCSICFEIYTDDTVIVKLPCNLKHIYHPACIREWLKRNPECPLCKARVMEAEGDHDGN
jgi:hypothetical protein